MKERVVTLILGFILFINPLFAYRDSVDYDSSGDGGLIFAIIIFGAFIVAFIVGLIRKMFQ